MKDNGVDMKKELEEAQELATSLLEKGVLTKGQLDILSGNPYTKEALEEANKIFDQLYQETDDSSN